MNGAKKKVHPNEIHFDAPFSFNWV